MCLPASVRTASVVLVRVSWLMQVDFVHVDNLINACVLATKALQADNSVAAGKVCLCAIYAMYAIYANTQIHTHTHKQCEQH